LQGNTGDADIKNRLLDTVGEDGRFILSFYGISIVFSIVAVSIFTSTIV